MEILPIQVDCVGLQDTEEAIQGGAATWELSAGEHSERGFLDTHRYRLCPGKEVSECIFYMVGADLMPLGSRLPSHLPTLHWHSLGGGYDPDTQTSEASCVPITAPGVDFGAWTVFCCLTVPQQRPKI